MAGTIVVTESEPVHASADARPWPAGEVLREISRGGVAGLIVGVLVGGLGGRLFMRVAALLHPEATGMATQNGNLVGDITLGGSLGLIIFVGLFVGIGVGPVWVTVQTWIPGSGLAKAIWTIPVAIALGSFGLLEVPNPDFLILGNDPGIVALIIVFTAGLGFSVAVVDRWLERRMPRAVTAGSAQANAYTTLTILGLALAAPVIVPLFVFSDLRWVGLSLIATGIATMAWWYQRAHGRAEPSRGVRIAGRSALVAAVIFGSIMVAMDGSAALGLR